MIKEGSDFFQNAKFCPILDIYNSPDAWIANSMLFCSLSYTVYRVQTADAFWQSALLIVSKLFHVLFFKFSPDMAFLSNSTRVWCTDRWKNQQADRLTDWQNNGPTDGLTLFQRCDSASKYYLYLKNLKRLCKLYPTAEIKEK